MGRVVTAPGRAAIDCRLSARDVTVRFGGLVALDGVHIDVPARSVVGLIGPNGAGKSTLFAVLSGLLRPTKGSVFLDGDDVTTSSAQQRAQRGLARTFQHPEVFTSLSVRDHVVLARRARHSRSRIWWDAVTAGGFRRPPAAEIEAVDSIIEMLGIADIAERDVVGLPLGQTRLVEIARALAFEPTVLLLDEATSGLDREERDSLGQTLVTVLRERDLSILMVEHDVDFVLGLSSEVYVLDFGLVIACGTPAEVRNDPQVKAAYLGEQLESAGTP